jgi:3-hydroxyisobutyrate dehydrogenase-like beta-hydroxyacid dehydrogenase
VKSAVIGLGEAGSRYATALASHGHEVVGVDPATDVVPDGVTKVESLADAVADADIVLVMTGAAVAESICQAVTPLLKPGACYADFTSSAPTLMERLAHLAEDRGAQFADVAILGPVSWHGARTPLMASGSGAARVAELLAPLGTDVEVLDAAAGAAMAHKLLRSVFMKSLASVVVEAVEAARAAGYEDWARNQIAAQLAGDGQAVIDRLLTGTQNHAKRRRQEMLDTADYLESMGVPAPMTRATIESLGRIVNQSAQAAS